MHSCIIVKQSFAADSRGNGKRHLRFLSSKNQVQLYVQKLNLPSYVAQGGEKPLCLSHVVNPT